VKFAATVLYEDKMIPTAASTYPLHDLVVRLVEDDVGVEAWKLAKRLFPNPRNGVGNILNDIGRTDFLAEAGVLCVLLDRDRIAQHVGLKGGPSDAEVVAKLRGKSDAPEKLHVFFLYPNVEGLLEGVAACDGALLPHNLLRAKERKSRNDRDIVLNELKTAARRSVRDCIRLKQPGLDGLARFLATLLATTSI
jgi:hypothetical protein